MAPPRKWVRTTLERYGKVEPKPEAWSLITPEGRVVARIWLERNPKDPWFEKWLVQDVFNRRAFEQGFTGAYPTGVAARQAAESWTGTKREQLSVDLIVLNLGTIRFSPDWRQVV